MAIYQPKRHPGEGRDPAKPKIYNEQMFGRIPAYAGMTV
jgi:hypothetical protein